MAGRIFQVVECLAEADGVSHTARTFATLLGADGVEPDIATLYASPALRGEATPLESIVWQPGDAIVVHVWGPSRLESLLQSFRGPRALYFHNITPPEFFPAGSASHRETRAGWEQLPRLAELADIWLAPSAFNLAALAEHVRCRRPQHVIPPVVDTTEERARVADPAHLEALRSRGEVNVLFVGRLAPNKAQDQVMEVFEHYHSRINARSRLHLVGNGSGNPLYVRSLAGLRARLAARDAIELPGKVSDQALAAYYRTADLFLCLSEHEGFCLPPLTAAAHGIPVIARAAAALPETIGPAAVLVHAYDPARIAELVHLLLEEQPLRERLQAAARAHLTRFTPSAVRTAWWPALAALRQ